MFLFGVLRPQSANALMQLKRFDLSRCTFLSPCFPASLLTFRFLNNLVLKEVCYCPDEGGLALP